MQRSFTSHLAPEQPVELALDHFRQRLLGEMELLEIVPKVGIA